MKTIDPYIQYADFSLRIQGHRTNSAIMRRFPFSWTWRRCLSSLFRNGLRPIRLRDYKSAPKIRMFIGESEDLEFRIDLLISEPGKSNALAVVDTKYKAPDAPSTDDVAQVVAYAEAKGCHEAALVYPTRLLRPLNTMVGEIRVRTLTFSLDGDLEQNGASFVRELLPDRI